MAQVTNFSSKPIFVTWDDAGTRRAITVPSKQQTKPAIDIDAITAKDGASIFEQDGWWSVPSTATNPQKFEAVVYDEPVTLTDNWFTSNLTLHCFAPGVQVTAANPVYTPYPHKDAHPYSHKGSDSVLDKLKLESPGKWLVSPSPSRNGMFKSLVGKEYKDGEYDRSWSIFGNYVQTRNFITVRLKLWGGSEFHRPHASDPTEVGDSVTLDELKAEWKQRIRAIWNAASVPAPTAPAGGTYPPLRIDVEWVEEDPHCCVCVADWTLLTKEEGSKGKKKSIWNRANMFRWLSGMDTDTRNVSAHEVGHYLGLIDSYMWDGEVVFFEEEIKKYAKKPGKSLSLSAGTAEFWHSPYVWLSGRARTRKKNGRTTATADLLETSSSKDVSQELVDAIASRTEQQLRWNERMWKYKDFDWV